MPKAILKEQPQAPWFGSFTPFDPNAPPPVLDPTDRTDPSDPSEFPETVPPVPNTYPAGRTYEGYLYELITTGIDASLPYTRGYLTDTYNVVSGLRGWHVDKLDRAQITSSGLSFDVEGQVRWEIGVDYDTAATGRADFITCYDPTVLANESQQISVGTNTAGQTKVVFNEQTTADIAFNATAATVATALAALSTIDGAGNVAVVGRNGGPWLVELKGTLAAQGQNLMTLAAGTTPLSGGSGQAVTRLSPGGTGADIQRWSSYADAAGVAATKLQIGAPAGTARNQTEFILFNAPAGLSGLSVRFRDDAGTVNGLNFTNTTTANRRCILNLNNLWQLGSDFQHADTENFHIVDSNASGTPIRFFLEGAPSNSLVPKAGVNTSNPLSMWHVQNSNDASLYDVVQTLFSGGYSTLSNRSLQFQQILDASQAVNFMWLMGTLDPASTRVTPKTLSIGPTCHGIESTNTTLSIISAPTGTAQTINRVIEVGNNTLGFFDTAPSAKATITGSRGANAALASLLTELAAKGLITDGSS